MEKTADYEYKVYKKDGKLILRLPGGREIPYDHRFPNCPDLMEGEFYIVTKED